MGKRGTVHSELLQKLNELDFYKQQGPKSLGREFLHEYIFPLLNPDIKLEDQLRTAYEHIATKISKTLNRFQGGTVLVTGGGAYNSYLLELLQQKTNVIQEIPDTNLIEFKEALLFAFLGVLRITNQANCLKSATGAKTYNIGGAVYKAV